MGSNMRYSRFLAFAIFVTLSSSVDPRQTSWAHRDIEVGCERGQYLTGHLLAKALGSISRSRCLARCLAQPRCQSINYVPARKECYLSDATRSSYPEDFAEGGDFEYCGPNADHVWQRTGKTHEITTTTTFQPATVPIQIPTTKPLNGDLRLVGGAPSNGGRVEIYNGGKWGTICDDGWYHMEEADVVCRQLGYPYASRAYPSAYFGQGLGPIAMVTCSGGEANLLECSVEFGIVTCGHDEDVSVTCQAFHG